jgi:hypothetical protein
MKKTITKCPECNSLSNDAKYLAKPLIEDAVFLIDENHIKITSPSTIYAETRRVIPICKDDFTALYKSVLKTAKEKKVKISYSRRIRRKSIDKWCEYIGACGEADALFYKVVEQAEVVQRRGLHYGTRDDFELVKLQWLCEDNRSYFYATSIVARVADDYFNLESISQVLGKSDSEVLKICL